MMRVNIYDDRSKETFLFCIEHGINFFSNDNTMKKINFREIFQKKSSESNEFKAAAFLMYAIAIAYPQLQIEMK